MASIVVSKSTGLGSNPGTPVTTVCRPTGRSQRTQNAYSVSSNLTKPIEIKLRFVDQFGRVNVMRGHVVRIRIPPNR